MRVYRNKLNQLIEKDAGFTHDLDIGAEVDNAQLSIAISLKRIADRLDKLPYATLQTFLDQDIEKSIYNGITEALAKYKLDNI